MDLPRFLIAKYVPDVFRNEPRNIGVVLWAAGHTAARFLGESAGVLDVTRVPGYVASPEAYRQWVRHWRRELDKPTLRPLTGGDPVPRASPAFLDVVGQSGPSNYLLCCGGRLLRPVPAEELPAAVDELFAELVEPQRAAAPVPPDNALPPPVAPTNGAHPSFRLTSWVTPLEFGGR